jgi:oxygen-independent coproporphyrinogen-3 oxidase
MSMSIMIGDSQVAVEEILAAIGPIPSVAYAASHVYPISAPAFQKTPLAERVRPTSGFVRLYVHVPFCNYACSFCFYAIVVRSERAKMDRYVAAVQRELEWIEPGTPISQLYVGGGTPTALPPDLLDRLLTYVFSRTRPFGSGVHSVETSPETLTSEHLRVLASHGVGRVSMGIQSLDDQVLTRVHRRHTKEQALAACRMLTASGLITNVDLIYGLPGQTAASFRRDLEQIVETGVQSLTLYNLRLNEATPVARVLSDRERFDLARLMQWRAFVQETAVDFGFTQTRWHTFIKNDSAATRHERLPSFDQEKVHGYQMGVGMSSHSQLGSSFYRNHRDFDTYVDRVENGLSPVEETFPLGVADRKTLFIARSLGDGKPLNREAYQHAFGSSIEDDFGPLLSRLRSAELVEENEERDPILSETGRLVYDLITMAFYPEHARHWLDGRTDVPLGQGRLHAP